MAASGNSVAIKSFQSFVVNEGLLAKVVEAVKAGEKDARTSGDVKSFEIFYSGFRQNISIGRIFIVPAKVCDVRNNFPIALLYGTVVKELNLGEETADLITNKMGDTEFDEYSQADYAAIKDKFFTNEEGDLTSLVIFAPHWSNIREYIGFKFTDEDDKLSNLLRHLVFSAYFNPAVSSAFDALMTTVDTNKLDVTDITPKLTYPFLTQNPLTAYPEFSKQGGWSKKKIFLTAKTADAITQEVLEPQELSVFDELDAVLTEVTMPPVEEMEDVADYKGPDGSNHGNAEIPEIADIKDSIQNTKEEDEPKTAAANPNRYPMSSLLAEAGMSIKEFMGFDENTKKTVLQRAADSLSKVSALDDGTELRHRPDYGEKGSYTQEMNEDAMKMGSEAPFETPFTNVGPGTSAHDNANKAIAVAVDTISTKGDAPIGIAIDETGVPRRAEEERKVAASYPQYTVNGRVCTSYEDANRYWEAKGGIMMEKLEGLPAHVLRERPLESAKSAKKTSFDIVAAVVDAIDLDLTDDTDALSTNAKAARVKNENHLNKYAIRRKKANVNLTEDSIWDAITEDFGEAPQVELPGEGSAPKGGDETGDSGVSESEPKTDAPKKDGFKSKMFNKDKAEKPAEPKAEEPKEEKKETPKEAAFDQYPGEHGCRTYVGETDTQGRAKGPGQVCMKPETVKIDGRMYCDEHRPDKSASAKMATWMNDYEIQDAQRRFAQDPIIGPVCNFLAAFADEVNSNSDGWHSWPLPAHAASSLMGLVQKAKDNSRNSMPGQVPVTVEDVKKAMAPIKAFMTRRGLKAGMVMPSLVISSKKVAAAKKATALFPCKCGRKLIGGEGEEDNYYSCSGCNKISTQCDCPPSKTGNDVSADISEAKAEVVSPTTVDADIKQPVKTVEEAAKVGGCDDGLRDDKVAKTDSTGDDKYREMQRVKQQEQLKKQEEAQASKSAADISGDISEAKAEVESPASVDADIKQPVKSVEEAAKVKVLAAIARKRADAISGDIADAKSELDAGAKAELADSPEATKTVNPEHFAAAGDEHDEAVEMSDTFGELADLADNLPTQITAGAKTGSYASKNFKSKKDFREAVLSGKQISLYNPGMGEPPMNGRATVEGPWYPEPHRWYAEVMVKDGIVVGVK